MFKGLFIFVYIPGHWQIDSNPYKTHIEFSLYCEIINSVSLENSITVVQVQHMIVDEIYLSGIENSSFFI